MPLSVVLGCGQRSVAHVRRNVTFNLLVGDVSEIARMNGAMYALDPPVPLGGQVSQGTQTYSMSQCAPVPART
jgi:hypothetical protein